MDRIIQVIDTETGAILSSIPIEDLPHVFITTYNKRHQEKIYTIKGGKQE